jgi:hypothetical protein
MKDSLPVELIFVADGELSTADGALEIIDADTADLETAQPLVVGQFLILSFWNIENEMLRAIDFEDHNESHPVRFRVKAKVVADGLEGGEHGGKRLRIRFLGPFRISHALGGDAEQFVG